MNTRIRRLGVVLTVLFLVLAGQITYLQVVDADHLANHPSNIRKVLRDYSDPRGSILTAEEEIAARSEPVESRFEFLREYPEGGLFGHVTGFFSFTFGASGIEKTYNDDLAGRSEDLQFRNLGDLLIGKEQTGTVVLTMSKAAQEAARDALGGRKGSVVALDPKTGAVLALYSEPSYDPSPLALHDQTSVREAFDLLTADPNNPMLPRGWRERYAPGSTFKILTAATALEAGDVTPETQYPVLRELDLPLTNNTLENFGGSSCGGSLRESFRRSCNTTFGQLGLDLGDKLIDGMESFGLFETVPLDLAPAPVRAVGPERETFEQEAPTFAFAGIGQGRVDVSPLHMALIGSAIANGGVIMRPHAAAEIRDNDGSVVNRVEPRTWRRAISQETADTVKSMMVEVVAGGTGTRGQIPGVEVAGKTGTAQAPGGPPHTWFVAFAPANDPVAVVAVIVERGGDTGSEETGGAVAAPVAKQVLEAILAGNPAVPGDQQTDE